MKKKESNPITDWEIPTIWEIIDRMEFKWLFGEVKEEPKKKTTRKMKSKKVKSDS
tara:strand:+ start:298 stop:462 length:165 start_codon:yes stop_codon:yes gene_type:complete